MSSKKAKNASNGNLIKKCEETTKTQQKKMDIPRETSTRKNIK